MLERRRKPKPRLHTVNEHFEVIFNAVLATQVEFQQPVNEYRNSSRIHKGERGIWQRRYWEHLIRSQKDYQRHWDYIHFNPVKHGHVGRAADWPYSSIHRYIRAGLIGPDWGRHIEDDDNDYGE